MAGGERCDGRGQGAGLRDAIIVADAGRIGATTLSRLDSLIQA